MPDKPPTTDPEQREHDTARSRHQSGLPPQPNKTKPEKPPLRPRDTKKQQEESQR